MENPDELHACRPTTAVASPESIVDKMSILSEHLELSSKTNSSMSFTKRTSQSSERKEHRNSSKLPIDTKGESFPPHSQGGEQALIGENISSAIIASGNSELSSTSNTDFQPNPETPLSDQATKAAPRERTVEELHIEIQQMRLERDRYAADLDTERTTHHHTTANLQESEKKRKHYYRRLATLTTTTSSSLSDTQISGFLHTLIYNIRHWVTNQEWALYSSIGAQAAKRANAYLPLMDVCQGYIARASGKGSLQLLIEAYIWWYLRGEIFENQALWIPSGNKHPRRAWKTTIEELGARSRANPEASRLYREWRVASSILIETIALSNNSYQQGKVDITTDLRSTLQAISCDPLDEADLLRLVDSAIELDGILRRQRALYVLTPSDNQTHEAHSLVFDPRIMEPKFEVEEALDAVHDIQLGVDILVAPGLSKFGNELGQNVDDEALHLIKADVVLLPATPPERAKNRHAERSSKIGLDIPSRSTSIAPQQAPRAPQGSRRRPSFDERDDEGLRQKRLKDGERDSVERGKGASKRQVSSVEKSTGLGTLLAEGGRALGIWN